MKLKPLSIKQRLALGFSLVTFMTILLGVFIVYELEKKTELMKNMYTHPYTVSNAVKDVRADMMTIHTMVLSMIINDDKNFIEEQENKIDIYDKEINANFEIIFERYLGSKEDVQKAFDLYNKTIFLHTSLVAIIKRGDLEKAKEFMNTNYYYNIEFLHKDIHVLTSFADNKAKEFFNATKKRDYELIAILLFSIVILVLISIFIAYKIITSITNPLKTLIDMSEKINRGDFSILKEKDSISFIHPSDELGQLFGYFHTLLSRLVLPYDNIIKSDRSLIEITDEVRRLLDSFDTNIIASKTDKAGKIVYTSKAFQKISGYTKDELLGKNQNIVRHQDMPPFLFKDLWKTIKNGENWDGEIKNKKKDGSFFWVNANISPDIDNKGNIIGYNAINEDITVTKAYEELSNSLENRIEKEIQKNNEKTGYIIQQSRLAQMGEMISMIAHQWRQPLSSISAISGTLTLDIMMENYNDKFFKEKLDSIGQLSQHLSKTIDDFRGFFKEDKKEEVSEVKNIIDDSIAIIGQALISKNINLSVEYIDNPKIKSHLNELKQVVLNLLKNAEDILLEKNTTDAKIWINVSTQDSKACITIEDNAGGVPEDIIEKIFDPYFSTKKAKDGTGLGLYMSKTIVKEHCNGELSLENTQNGASFTIKIPLFIGDSNE